MAEMKMKASDVSEVMGLVCEEVACLAEKGVQVMYLCNGASMTVEFSAFKTRLKTVSIIMFPGDLEQKKEFLLLCLKSLVNSDSPYDYICHFDKEYKRQFVF